MKNARSNDTRDRMLFLLGAIALAIALAWYAFTFAVNYFKIQFTNVTVLFIAAEAIPSSSAAALVLLIGWGIQTRRQHPPILFLAFVILKAAGWATALGATIWLYTSLGSPIGPRVVVLNDLYTVAAAVDAIALFLLLVLALPPRIRAAFS